jgi:hypothetical protein
MSALAIAQQVISTLVAELELHLCQRWRTQTYKENEKGKAD